MGLKGKHGRVMTPWQYSPGTPTPVLFQKEPCTACPKKPGMIQSISYEKSFLNKRKFRRKN
jgi:hypothetical protein